MAIWCNSATLNCSLDKHGDISVGQEQQRVAGRPAHRALRDRRAHWNARVLVGLWFDAGEGRCFLREFRFNASTYIGFCRVWI